MENLFKEDHLILSFLWISWCVLHSVIISVSVTHYLKSHFGKMYRYYRLSFNIISILTLIPVIWYSYLIKSETVFQWTGFFILFQVTIIILSVYFFYAGGKHYDSFQFLGIRQIYQENSYNLISENGELDTKGILCVTRHPWYLASILIIWARNLDLAAIIINFILTGYLVIGTILEERKLVAEFGNQYREYQKKVSMLFPVKWIKSVIKKIF